MESSESTLTEKMNQALEEVIALGYLVYQNGNFIKADGLITAARFIASALGPDCSSELLARLDKLDDMIQKTQTCCDWVI